jgi:serine phosphatase RsbU (regulator of sigma subunit)
VRTALSRPTQARRSQAEKLEEVSRSLAEPLSAPDLVARFEHLLHLLYESAKVRVAFRSTASSPWSMPSGPLPSPPALGDVSALSPASLDADGCLLQALRRGPDGSTLWVAVEPASSTRFNGADLLPFHLACTLFDAAYRALLQRRHEKGLLFSLNQSILQLNSLIETGIEIARLSTELSPHSMALERAAGLTNASRGCVTLTSGESVLEKILFPAGPETNHSGGTYEISAEFTFGGVTYSFQLFDKESRTGPVPFDATDRLLLDTLSRQVHAALENRFLHRQSLEKERIEQDIAVAASIQQRILPTSLPPIQGYDAAGINIPSKSVGGDYFDCIPLPDGRVALVIADVSGKGVPAALLVSSLHAYLNAYLDQSLPLLDLVRRLNSAVHRTSTDDKFITAFLGILTPSSGMLEAVNAGHCVVYWRKADGRVVELSQGGIPFGMLGIDFPYQSETVALGPGDRLLLYTDGITEAHDDQSRLYDSEGALKEFFAAQTPADAHTFITDLIADVRAFAGTAPQADDITALYLMRNA